MAHFFFFFFSFSLHCLPLRHTTLLQTLANSCGRPGGRRGGLPSIGGVCVNGMTNNWKSSGFMTSHAPLNTPSIPVKRLMDFVHEATLHISLRSQYLAPVNLNFSCVSFHTHLQCLNIARPKNNSVGWEFFFS